MRLLKVLPLTLAIASPVFAESLRFQAYNPSFGGNPLNSSHFMGLATKQFTPPTIAREVQSDLEYFSDQIQRRTLSAISSAFTAELRNLDLDDPYAILPEPFSVGDFYVSYERNASGNIVLNLEQGDDAISVIVPNF